MPEIICLILILLGVFALVRMMNQLGSKGRDPGNLPLPDAATMKKFIIWKSFYVNPDDPRGWVPKTWGGGLTVNFRTRQNAGIFAGLIILTTLAAAVLVYLVLFCGTCHR